MALNRQDHPLKFTQKQLMEWGGPDVFREAEQMVKRGAVLRADIEGDRIEGTIARGTHDLKSALRLLPGGKVESLCPCWLNREQGRVCPHIVALALCILKRRHDPARAQKYREEQRRAQRLSQIDPGRYHRRAKDGDSNARRATLEIEFPDDWRRGMDAAGTIDLLCRIRVEDKRCLPEQVPPEMPLLFSPQDDALMYVLEDIAEGPLRAKITLSTADVHNLLELCRGRDIHVSGGAPLTVRPQAAKNSLHIALDDDSGELVLLLKASLAENDIPNPDYVVNGRKGWLIMDNRIRPIEPVLPLPYHMLYRGPVRLPREHVPGFLSQELDRLKNVISVESDISADWLQLEPAEPAFVLQICGSPASLALQLHAHYEATTVDAGAPSPTDGFAIPDPTATLQYRVRNPEAEHHAILRLNGIGVSGTRGDRLEPVTGTRAVLNLIGSGIPALRREGWKVEFDGRIRETVPTLEQVLPIVRIRELNDAGSFEVDFRFEDEHGESLSQAKIQQALQRGEAFLEHGGRTLLIDAEAVRSMRAVFRDCAGADGQRPGSFRMSAVHAPFVAASLQALDGIDVEQPAAWLERCNRHNRRTEPPPPALPAELNDRLRPYQRQGVAWLHFLESHGFGGILADEMGLGKTVQTLAWLQMPRIDTAVRGQPILIVCPTSLVENWVRESQRFAPVLRVLAITGTGRHVLWETVERHDLLVTSYALLRRDLDRYLDMTFSAVVLDEAQHIKNRSTRNAVAAKQLRAAHRIVLTGTPIENSVADLWSIMDFLMPGYLGAYDQFREHYEVPFTRTDAEGDAARVRLKRKLHPFLLRRLKRDVAKDLPPKLEKTSFCVLSDDQQRVYNDLYNQSRMKIRGMVDARGFNAARIEILALLMKLRQVCCHLELLRDTSTEPVQEPSSKMTQFFELLDEAIDGGHRMLVFSQFVRMLKILARELKAREVPFAYLDGATRNRLDIVRNFNRNAALPVFLISLKAGGTGLNLTGADMVVHFDPWWNPAVEDQATDRAHRIGQTRTVYDIKLITEHTVEENVLALQERKRKTIRDTIEGAPSPTTQWTWEDVREVMNL